MSDPYFFGYGSLVNDRTHAYRGLAPARLAGWRREWRTTRLRPVAFLSARPAPGSQIGGAIAAVPGGDWAALDAREAAYGRHDVSADVDHAVAAAERIAVYRVQERLARRRRGAILLSYVDVVVEGLAAMHGPAEVAAFFDETDHWDRPIINDRRLPVYRRHVPTDAATRDLVDAHLAGSAAVVEELE